MFATIRDRKGQGNAAIYVRVRDVQARYWNFVTLVWEATESADSRVFLTEYADTDPYQSRYSADVTMPYGDSVVEYVSAADSSVIGEETYSLSATSGGSGGGVVGGSVMLLSARMLTHVRDANSFEYSSTAEFTEGDEGWIFFQLIDASIDEDLNPHGRRYVPAAGATLTVRFQSVDSSKTVERDAAMAFPDDDRSVWKFHLLETDPLVGTKDMKLTLVEGTDKTSGYVKQALSVHASDGSF